MPRALGNTGLLYGRGLPVACHHLAGDRGVSTPRFALPPRLYDTATATPVASGPEGRRHELDEVRLPQPGVVMAEMAVRVGSGWDQHIAAVFDALHRPLDGAELGRVGVVLSVVDQQHLGRDLVEVRLRIVKSWIASIAQSWLLASPCAASASRRS